MAKVNKFEELVVWQKSMDFCDQIFHIINNTPLKNDYALKDQMNRSSISIPSNIAEGFERNSKKQFVYFLVISKASAGEIRTQLHLTKRRNYITESNFENLLNDVNQIGKMLGSLINYLKKDPGYKKVAEPEIKYGKLISSIVDEITISSEIYL